ncbi:cytochrome C oxidase subunit IV family protein [Jiella marina]|uniref:hypothetical protein n=1 Tax=Jiella sp. LLJ827 TaxID=2917712 RepID=UPI00210116B9|nr:hypothetical protein [Jiella sp. LLJ827]MCQ0987070.1 hypothetical protein [Jiella sp. LLJ827]
MSAQSEKAGAAAKDTMSARAKRAFEGLDLFPEVTVFAALVGLAALSLILALLPLFGSLSLLVSLLIAAVMAALVLIFFMHMRRAMTVVVLSGMAGIVWLTILFGLTLSDYLTRAGPFGSSIEPPPAVGRVGEGERGL